VILSNRRFAEIYRLRPSKSVRARRCGRSFELRVAAGTCETAADDYLSFA